MGQLVISHLLFTYDPILLCEAKVEQAHIGKGIQGIYGNTSNKCVNPD